MIFDTCFGLLLRGSLVDARNGFVLAMLNCGAVGAVITAWGSTFTNFGDLHPLKLAIANGMNLGAALAKFRFSPAAQDGRTQLCLLGDPDIRISSRTPSKVGKEKKIERKTSAPRNKGDSIPFSFFSTFLNACQNGNAVAFIDSSVAHSPNLLVGRSADDRLEKQLGDAGLYIRRKVISAVHAYGTMPCRQWLPICDDLFASSRVGKCFVCDENTTEMLASIRSSKCVRELVLCPNCGSIDDRPANSRPLTMRVSHSGIITLRGDLPQANWDAVLLVETTKGLPPSVHEWKRDSAGMPTRKRRLGPNSIPAGIAIIALLLVHNDSFRMLRVPLRGESFQTTN
jgi:hypothetical protein